MKSNAFGLGLVGAVLLTASSMRSSAASFSYEGGGDFVSGSATYEWVTKTGIADLDFGIVTIRLGVFITDGPFMPTIEIFSYSRPMELPPQYHLQTYAGGPTPLVISYQPGAVQTFSGNSMTSMHNWTIIGESQTYIGATVARVFLNNWSIDADGELHVSGLVTYQNISPLALPSIGVADGDSTVATMLLVSLGGLAFIVRRKSSNTRAS